MAWRLSVAPMMEWTDRHCRHLHRLLTRHTRLYTEMVNAGAVVHGGTERHLRFDPVEHPVALQLGGSEPTLLAQAARLGAQWGYDEVNLNCGCPSPRVKRGAFGACLMAEPALVADCLKAMQDVVNVPVTVKHRIGLNREEAYSPLRDFVGALAEVGCRVFIVHARNAWLDGLSPKENRRVPPLRYERVWQLKQDFPQLCIVVNGGVSSDPELDTQLAHVDGVMVGREAYHRPWWLRDWDARLGGEAPSADVDAVEEAYVEHMARDFERHGTPWPTMARHMLGLRHGQRGARLWRQVWSDHHLRDLPVHTVWQRAQQALHEAV